MSPSPRLTRGFIRAQRRRRWWRSYARSARRPVYALVVLLPLLVVYEAGIRWLTPQGMAVPLLAQGLIRAVLGWVGVTGSWLPPLLVLAVLFAWFFSQGTGWQIRPLTLATILLEGLLLALPLLLMSRLFLSTTGALLDGAGRGQVLLDALGAAVYEEFVFRLVLLGLVQTALRSHLGMARPLAQGLCMVISSSAFMAAHFMPLTSLPWAWSPAMFYGLAGLYLGLIFVKRGLAVTVCTHALYNLLVALFRLEAVS